MSIKKCLALFVLFIALFSCSHPSKNSNGNKSEVQEMIDRITSTAEDDFETQQELTDEMYMLIKNRQDCKAEAWLSFQYFFLCCYNGGSEEEVRSKMELYTGRFLGHSGWDVVKNMDPIWFSNIQRSTELLIRAYEDNPSLTTKLIEETYTLEAFQAFAKLVIRNS